MKTPNQLFIVRGFKFYLAVIVLGLAVILFSGCQLDATSPPQIPNFPTPTIDQVLQRDPVIGSSLEQIDEERQNLERYRSQGQSPYGLLLNISLALSGLAASIIAIIVGLKLWGKTGRRGLRLLLGLSIFVLANSGVGVLLKMQHDAFFAQNRNQYANLANDINKIIKEFDIYFAAHASDHRSGVRDIAELRAPIRSDADSALEDINNVKCKYRERFNLNVVCQREIGSEPFQDLSFTEFKEIAKKAWLAARSH